MRSSLNINGRVITADHGETLIDAALTEGILIPHDCASGTCETCRVRVPWGEIDDGGTIYGETVLACQARVAGDATITFEESPAVTSVRGKVESISELSPNVAEVVIRTGEGFAHRPGQYARLTFDGYPPREYSYSAPLRGPSQPDQAVFHMRRLAKGKVSSAIGKAIGLGHNVRLNGPFGSAFLRHHETSPIVLTSSGTGFAPMWSLARAVIGSGTTRDLILVAGASCETELYMKPALDWLSNDAKIPVVATLKHGDSGAYASGTADQHLPELCDQSIIHVAGNPPLVNTVKQRALEAGAMCYADPFTPSTGTVGWRDRLPRLMVPGLGRNGWSGGTSSRG